MGPLPSALRSEEGLQGRNSGHMEGSASLFLVKNEQTIMKGYLSHQGSVSPLGSPFFKSLLWTSIGVVRKSVRMAPNLT